MKLSCQEQLIPGDSISAKWEFAKWLGFDAIELLGRGNLAFEGRLPELKAAQGQGAVFSSVCVAMSNYIGEADSEARRDAIANVKSQLTVIAQLGGVGVVTPTSFGKASNSLPPMKSPLSKDEQRRIMLDSADELGRHAQAEGVLLLLEPLNRYETNFMHKLSQGIEICREIGHPSLKVMGDLYHMNIEEDDPNQSLLDAGDMLAHVHVCDSNRAEPGAGHIDFAAAGGALRSIGYDGFLALECGLRADPEEALRNTVALLRQTMG